MTEMINPVEPFDGVPIQVPSQGGSHVGPSSRRRCGNG